MYHEMDPAVPGFDCSENLFAGKMSIDRFIVNQNPPASFPEFGRLFLKKEFQGFCRQEYTTSEKQRSQFIHEDVENLDPDCSWGFALFLERAWGTDGLAKGCERAFSAERCSYQAGHCPRKGNSCTVRNRGCVDIVDRFSIEEDCTDPIFHELRAEPELVAEQVSDTHAYDANKDETTLQQFMKPGQHGLFCRNSQV